MAETAKEWVRRVFGKCIKSDCIVIARGVKTVKNSKGKDEDLPTGANIFVTVDNFSELFKDEIEAGGKDIDIANAIAAKTVTREVQDPKTGNITTEEVGFGYREFIEDMAAQGLFR